MPNIKLTNVKFDVYNENCIGCQTTKSEVMLSLFSGDKGSIQLLNGNNEPVADSTFLDLFISKENLKDLKNSIEKYLKEN